MKYLLVGLFCLYSLTASSQSTKLGVDSTLTTYNAKDTVLNNVNSDKMETDDGIYNLLTTKEFWLSVGVLLLLLFVLLLETVLIKNGRFSEDAAIKLYVLTIVIFGVLFLFVAGYSDKQVAPAFGLFGTISGYIFGKVSSAKENNN